MATSATKAELAADQCKGKAAIGTVIDETPLLEKPLEGLAYAVSGFGDGVLPHVVFILGGQVTVMPQGESTTVSGGRLQNVDPGDPRRPDRPLPPHPLRRRAGLPRKHRKPLRGKPGGRRVSSNGQNGKSITQQVKAKTACKAKKHKRHKLRHRAHGRG